jgi:hypothetical protein
MNVMPDRLTLPLGLLSNLLPVLSGVHIHAEAPLARPVSSGPYDAVIDTGSSHTWIKPVVGNGLQPHSLEGYVIDRGDGVQEEAGIDVKAGFMRGLSGSPRRGWVQLDVRLPAIEMLLLSGDFDMPTDVLIGMDLIASFLQFAVVIRGTETQPFLQVEF